MKNLTKTELVSIMDEVQKHLDESLGAEAARVGTQLSKAHPGEDTSAEVPPDESSTSPSGPDASASPPPPDASAAPPDASASPDASATPPDASAVPPEAGADDSMGGGEVPPSPEEIKQAYDALPLDQLQVHYLAAKQALVEKMGAPGNAGPPAPDQSAAPPAPDASASAPPPALKSEGKQLPNDEKANGQDPLHAVKKSENSPEFESLTKKLADQDEALKSLVGAMKKIVEAPVRKAIVSTADLQAAPQDFSSLTKSEVDQKLRRVARNPLLSKSERGLITSFTLGHVGVDAVKDLLTKAQ